MKKKTVNRISLFTFLGLGILLATSSCTASFCSNKDLAHIMYPYEEGVTTYIIKDNAPEGAKKVWDENPDLYAYTSYDENTCPLITSTTNTAKYNKISIPSDEYWYRMDMFTLEEAFASYSNPEWYNANSSLKDLYPVPTKATAKLEQINECLTKFGYLKFYTSGDDDQLWTNWNKWTNYLRSDTQLGIEQCPSTDFESSYKSAVNAKVSSTKACISTRTGEFGNFGYNHTKVEISQKDWSYAWSKGFIEGLLVYPVAWLVDTFAHGLGMNGWGQIWSIVLVTMIVRTIMLLLTFKTTLGQQKMTLLQPELNKIQAKYPNSNTNQAQKQRLAQEQMALYKKNHINPLGSILVLIIQFPIFIAVWSAMTGAAVLGTDAVLNLYLSDSVWTVLSSGAGLPSNDSGWWTALVLIIIMSLSQFVSMKLPTWLQKRATKNQPKLSKNPAQNKTQNQMKWFSYIMLVMIIIMGFTLPAGMGVYWIVGALFSCLQTVIIQFVLSRSIKKKRSK